MIYHLNPPPATAAALAVKLTSMKPDDLCYFGDTDLRISCRPGPIWLFQGGTGACQFSRTASRAAQRILAMQQKLEREELQERNET